MKMRRKYFYILCCLLFSSASLPAQNETASYEESLKLIEVWLDAQKDFEDIP